MEYDGRGSPDHDLEEARKSAEASDYEGVIRNLRSSLGTIKIYPCEFLHHELFLVL